LGKLVPLSANEVIHILRRNGFESVRQRGSHVVMQKANEGGTTTVPVPDHKEIKVGTLRVIIRHPACLASFSKSSAYADKE